MNHGTTGLTEARRLRDYFDSKYKPSDFSTDFLADENLTEITRKLGRIDHMDGVEERLSQFILTWDENEGYNNTPHMIQMAQESFMRTELRQREKQQWLRQFQIINPLTTDDLKPLRQVSDYRVRQNDFTPDDANDRQSGTVSTAARCRIFRTPYRGNTPLSQDSQPCQSSGDSAPAVTPFILRPESLHPHPVRHYSRRVHGILIIGRAEEHVYVPPFLFPSHSYFTPTCRYFSGTCFNRISKASSLFRLADVTIGFFLVAHITGR